VRWGGKDGARCAHEVGGSPLALLPGAAECPVALPCPRCGRPATKWCFAGWFLDRRLRALLARIARASSDAERGWVLESSCGKHRPAAERVLGTRSPRRAGGRP